MALKTLAALIGIGFAGLAFASGSGATVPGQNGKLLLERNDSGEVTFFLTNPVSQKLVKVPATSSTYSGSFSPNGKSLAYIANPRDQLWIGSATNLLSPIQLTDQPESYIEDPVFAPGGNRVFYLSADGFSDWSLESIPTVGGDPTAITALLNLRGGIDIPPDGKSIAYGGSDLHLMDPDGENVRDLETGLPATSPSFSPDGSRLAFSAPDSDGVEQIHSISRFGSGIRQLTTGPEGGSRPVFSPDGRKIAYTTAHTPYSEGDHVRVMNANGSNSRRLPSTVGMTVDDWQRKAPFILRKAVHTFGPLRIVKLEAEVFGPGRLRLSGRFVKATTRVFKSGRTVTVPIKLSLKKAIARKGKARLTVRARFEPAGGLPNKIKRSFTMGLGN